MAQKHYRLTKKRTSFILLLSIVLVLLLIVFSWQRTDKAPESEPNTDNRDQIPICRDRGPVFSQRRRDREKMVSGQIKARGIADAKVINAMLTVPRHFFVRPSDSGRAYSDSPLQIGLNQTISQPYIVAYMTEVLSLGPNATVLEIGTGSGYQAAVCAEIARKVYTVEILEKLARSAEQRLNKLGYTNISVKSGDGYYGWREFAPYDAIIVTCGADFVPPALIEQLKPGGRMVIPVGSSLGIQTLMLITKDAEGIVQSRSFLPVRFVPMLGRVKNNK